jgi:hypothetical protein
MRANEVKTAADLLAYARSLPLHVRVYDVHAGQGFCATGPHGDVSAIWFGGSNHACCDRPGDDSTPDVEMWSTHDRAHGRDPQGCVPVADVASMLYLLAADLAGPFTVYYRDRFSKNVGMKSKVYKTWKAAHRFGGYFAAAGDRALIYAHPEGKPAELVARYGDAVGQPFPSWTPIRTGPGILLPKPA